MSYGSLSTVADAFPNKTGSSISITKNVFIPIH
jgi:hypothetical protein